jgi:hypothetical protein
LETVSEEKCPKINLKCPFKHHLGALLDNGNVSKATFVQKTGAFLDISSIKSLILVQRV